MADPPSPCTDRDWLREAGQIKALGSIWGGQHGLLSVGELALLMRLVRDEPGPLRALEVGHYHGLSTCGMVRALADRDDWTLLTVDSHEADCWVGKTEPADFHRNRLEHFDSPRLSVQIARSQTLGAPLEFDAVFYDGDHADEQRRFTEQVIASPAVRLFVFDDRDFAVPRECCDLLNASGWFDESPAVERVRGQGDKTNPDTMTLGVFRRGIQK